MPVPSIRHEKYEHDVRRGDLKAIVAVIALIGGITAMAFVLWLLVIIRL